MNAPIGKAPPPATAPLNAVNGDPAKGPVLPVAKPNLSPSAGPTTQVTKPPPFSMQKADSSTDRWLKLMIYGKPGSGKTTLLGSAADVPDMQDILFADCEKGKLAIEDNERILQPNYLLDNHIEVTRFEQIAYVHQYLTAHCKYRDANDEVKLRQSESVFRGCKPEDIEKPKRFRSVMIDSLTEVDQFCAYNVLGVGSDLIKQATDVDNAEVAGWPEFRKINQMMQMMLRGFRSLPIHLLVSCGRAWSEDEMKKRYYMPQLTGQLRNQAMGIFDMVGFIESIPQGDKEERRVYVKPSSRFDAKNRRSVFKADFFKDPTMTDIMKGIALLK